MVQSWSLSVLQENRTRVRDALFVGRPRVRSRTSSMSRDCTVPWPHVWAVYSDLLQTTD